MFLTNWRPLSCRLTVVFLVTLDDFYPPADLIQDTKYLINSEQTRHPLWKKTSADVCYLPQLHFTIVQNYFLDFWAFSILIFVRSRLNSICQSQMINLPGADSLQCLSSYCFVLTVFFPIKKHCFINAKKFFFFCSLLKITVVVASPKSL